MNLRSIFAKTLYDWRRSLFFFSLGLFLTVIMYAAMFPAIAESSELVGALENLPDAFKSLVGEVELFTTPNGFLAGEFYSATFPIVLTILAITMGSGLLSNEEESGTIELLLSRPVSRLSLYQQKFLALLFAPFLLGVVTLIALWIGSIFVPEFDINLLRVMYATASAVLLAWSFGALSYVITTIRSRRGLSAGITSVYLVGGFIIATFVNTVSWLDPFRWVSLYQGYSAQEIILNNSGYLEMLALLAATFLLFLFGAWFFDRKDIGA